MYLICVCVLRFSCYQCVGLPYEHHHFNVSHRKNDYYSNTVCSRMQQLQQIPDGKPTHNNSVLNFTLPYCMYYHIHVLHCTCCTLYVLGTVLEESSGRLSTSKTNSVPNPRNVFIVCVCVCVRVRVCSVKSPPPLPLHLLNVSFVRGDFEPPVAVTIVLHVVRTNVSQSNDLLK
ncbi:unnamed protein product [Arctogadus glacialis]